MKLLLQDRLLEARKKKAISQQDLGKAAKVHFSNVGKYERGESVPAADILNRIAKVLEVSIDYYSMVHRRIKVLMPLLTKNC